MTIRIKEIENGWLVHYEVFHYEMTGYCEQTQVKDYETDKAFVYDFEDEMLATWQKLMDFLDKQFSVSLLAKNRKELKEEREKKEATDK